MKSTYAYRRSKRRAGLILVSVILLCNAGLILPLLSSVDMDYRVTSFAPLIPWIFNIFFLGWFRLVFATLLMVDMPSVTPAETEDDFKAFATGKLLQVVRDHKSDSDFPTNSAHWVFKVSCRVPQFEAPYFPFKRAAVFREPEIRLSAAFTHNEIVIDLTDEEVNALFWIIAPDGNGLRAAKYPGAIIQLDPLDSLSAHEKAAASWRYFQSIKTANENDAREGASMLQAA